MALFWNGHGLVLVPTGFKKEKPQVKKEIKREKKNKAPVKSPDKFYPVID